ILKDLLRVQQSIGYCPQFDALFDDLTAREHLQLYTRLRDLVALMCYLLTCFQERHHTKVQYQLKSERISLAQVFSKMEQVVEVLGIEDYSKQSDNLEQQEVLPPGGGQSPLQRIFSFLKVRPANTELNAMISEAPEELESDDDEGLINFEEERGQRDGERDWTDPTLSDLGGFESEQRCRVIREQNSLYWEMHSEQLTVSELCRPVGGMVVAAGKDAAAGWRIVPSTVYLRMYE
ncbi:hypothetical protein GOODEAATRI_012531, partial [Goodea atripinnis]